MTHPASLPLEQLLADCQSRRQRRSGPGGQHRNKVETAVIFRHLPTGTEAAATERRSQEANRRVALFRLRVRLALNHREVSVANRSPSTLWASRCKAGRIQISAAHDDFPSLLAEALDTLYGVKGDVGQAASRLGCSNSQLLRLLRFEHAALAQLNVWRREQGESALK